MNVLSGLTLVALPQKVVLSPELQRRNRFCEHLTHQVGLATALRDGTSYSATFRHWQLSDEGEKTLVTSERRLRRWFAQQSDGSFLLTLKWGVHPIELQKGKAGIVVADVGALVDTLSGLLTAAQGGELDGILAAAHKRRQQKSVAK